VKVVIVGCGRVGAHLATTLDHRGDSVTVVDLDPNAFSRLEAEFSGVAVRGTGIDEDVLRQAGIDEADAFFAVTNWDNTNLMAAQVAQTVFGITTVAARVYDPVRAEIFANMGIITICPTITITNLLLDAIEEISA
jgi:trk system potassium uptake protein TrkA